MAAAIARAARQLTETSDIQLRLRLAPAATDFHPDIEYDLLRIVQEAIANAIKHSGAGVIEVTMRCDQRTLTISVRDDGAGFESRRHLEQNEPGHYGLIGMRERATQVGAEIDWESEPKAGTTVTIRRPLSPSRSSSADPQHSRRVEPEELSL